MPDLNELSSGNLFVTGELGSGKTMYAVQMIRSYMLAGRPVCTNLNIFLDEMFPMAITGKHLSGCRISRQGSILMHWVMLTQ